MLALSPRLCLAVLLASNAAALGEYAIRDGDTVVFLGDSITAARGYGKVVENYTLLRYPDRKVRFINAGWGGDTAEGGAARFERDVLAHGATLVTVAYGINDIGWGTKADEAHKQKYLDGIRSIVSRCKARGVRVYICSAAATAENPDTAEKGYLVKMCDEGMALSVSLGGGAIDVQRSMHQILRRIQAANAKAKEEKDKQSLHAPDGIHLNDLGQIAMAFAIIKGLGAPAEVSSAGIDAAEARIISASGCKLSDVRKLDGGGIEFTRLDEGSPLNFGPLGALNFWFIPIPDELDRYMLTVTSLPPGKYDLTVNGRALGTYTAEQLAGGTNLCSATADPWEPGGPWDAQAAMLKMLTDARSELAQSQKMSKRYLDGNPNRADMERQAEDVNARIETLQRLTARPVACRWVLTPHK